MAKVKKQLSGMTKIQEKKFLADVLVELNEVRALVGLKAIKRLPKGALRDSMRCPQAIGLGDDGATCRVDVAGWINITRTVPELFLKVKGGSVTYFEHIQIVDIETPKNMSRFITLFDSGQLPQFAVNKQEAKQTYDSLYSEDASV